MTRYQKAQNMALKDYDDFQQAVRKAELRGVHYYKGVDDKELIIVMERGALMAMEYWQLRLMSEVCQAMTEILNEGGDVEDLELWKSIAIEEAKIYNNRSKLRKVFDAVTSILFPF